jgi:uncharacterized protein with PQ loop repeat
MIAQPQVFIGQCVDVSRFFLPGAGATMLEHAFYNGIGTFAVVVDFFEVLFQSFRISPSSSSSLSPLSFILSLFHFFYQFVAYFRKVVDKVQRILYFMGNAGGEFAQGSHFFGLDELGLGGF